MPYAKQHDLGIAGLALLRTWLIGDDNITRDILKEVYAMTTTIENSVSLTLEKVNTYDVQKGYQEWAATYDHIPNLLIEAEEPTVKSLLKEFPIGKALDAGCGTGRYSKFLHSLGHSVTGVDISQGMLRKARAGSQKIKFVQGDLTALPLENDSVDLAISALALTHLPEINTALAELSRVVRSGGHILISDIHPWLVALGGQADFHDKAGSYGYVRNYVHWHSAYIQAFNHLKLKIMKCIEPKMDSEHIKLAQGGFNLSTTTITAAFEGLPIALIWVLEKA